MVARNNRSNLRKDWLAIYIYMYVDFKKTMQKALSMFQNFCAKSHETLTMSSIEALE